MSNQHAMREADAHGSEQGRPSAGVGRTELYNFVVRCTANTDMRAAFLSMGPHASINFYASQTRIVVLAPTGGRFCAMLSSSGEIGFMGLRSVPDYRLAPVLLADVASRITGEPVRLHNLRCNNIQGVLRLPYEIDVVRLARDEKGAIVSYKPSIITAAKVSQQFVDAAGVVHNDVGMVYASGNVVITGINVPEALYAAADRMARVLAPYCTSVSNAKWDTPHTGDERADAAVPVPAVSSTSSQTRQAASRANVWSRMHAQRFGHAGMVSRDRFDTDSTPVYRDPSLPLQRYEW